MRKVLGLLLLSVGVLLARPATAQEESAVETLPQAEVLERLLTARHGPFNGKDGAALAQRVNNEAVAFVDLLRKRYAEYSFAGDRNSQLMFGRACAVLARIKHESALELLVAWQLRADAVARELVNQKAEPERLAAAWWHRNAVLAHIPVRVEPMTSKLIEELPRLELDEQWHTLKYLEKCCVGDGQVIAALKEVLTREGLEPIEKAHVEETLGILSQAE